MKGPTTGEAVQGQRPRGWSVRGQVALLGAVLVVGTGAVSWLIFAGLDRIAPGVELAPMWRLAIFVGVTLAAALACLALMWRIVRRLLSFLDQVVRALDCVSLGDVNQRLPESGTSEMRRVAAAFNSAIE